MSRGVLNPLDSYYASLLLLLEIGWRRPQNLFLCGLREERCPVQGGIVLLVFLVFLISYVDRGNLRIAAVSLMRDSHRTSGPMGALLFVFVWSYDLL